MNKKQSAIAIGLITASLLTLQGLWKLGVIFGVLNTAFIHEFLTMKGH